MSGGIRERLTRFICDGLDLEVIWILASPVVLALLIPSAWTLGLAALLPQGRIYVRAAWDYPAMKKSPVSYLVVNEAIVVVAVGIVWLINLALHRHV